MMKMPPMIAKANAKHIVDDKDEELFEINSTKLAKITNEWSTMAIIESKQNSDS